VTFSFFGPQNSFPLRKTKKNKEKRIFYIHLRILLPIHILLLKLKQKKIDSPYNTVTVAGHMKRFSAKFSKSFAIKNQI
jgi:hypothetical protein